MKLFKLGDKERELGIRNSIFIYFSVTAFLAIVLIVISMFIRFSNLLVQTVREDNSGRVRQVSLSMESYIGTVIKLSDSLSYGVIKNKDLEKDDVGDQFLILYDSYRSFIEDIALFSQDGELLQVVPAAKVKSGYGVEKELWFNRTLERPETIQFSTPEVQHIFDTPMHQYKWVNMLTRSVEITKDGKTEQAVLLIDLSYTGLEDVLKDVKLGNGGYIYLIDADGEIIWHPKGSLAMSGRFAENNLIARDYRDGTHEEIFHGESRSVMVKTVGYTGWRVVGVVPDVELPLNSLKMRIFFVFVIALIFFLVSVVNAYISSRITNPIHALEKSVKKLEGGDLDAQVYVGGSYEIQHLGKAVDSLRLRVKKLMKDLDEEHELKMKKEFEVLQEQINPHFLYNTLESIVWMIEGEKASVAVKMVTSLAKFFRIALSEGETIISVKNEIEHVTNYLMIQHMRGKDKFDYTVEIAEDVDAEHISSLKIMLQPIVENAIYHGMEYMYGDGLIEIRVWKKDEDIYFMVKDNGPGMTQETIENLLSDKTKKVQSKRGSGIGVKNVHERIRLYYGEQYGLRIHSELDVGTEVILHLPIKEYRPKAKKG